MKEKYIELNIDSLSLEGLGKGSFNNKPVIILGALPGEKVKAKVIRVKKDTIFTHLEEVLIPSPIRVKPVCPYFAQCGGCSFQHLDYSNQLIEKHKILRKAFSSLDIDEDYLPPLFPSKFPLRYRNKIELTFAEQKGDLILGFNKKWSFKDILNIEDCFLAPKEFVKISQKIKTFFKKISKRSFHPVFHKGFLRNISLRKSFALNKVFINLVTSSQDSFREDELLNEILEFNPLGVLWTINDSPAMVVRKDMIKHLYGNTHITEKILNYTFKYSPFSFFQINPSIFEQILIKIKEWLAPNGNEKIIDFYSGIGVIGIFLADSVKEVIAIEQNQEAIKDAYENAKLNGVENIRFIKKKAEDIKLLPFFPDIIIFDPPRAGVHPKLIKRVVNLKPKRIVYLSCNISTLAQDSRLLLKYYNISKIQSFDCFPNTAYQEVLVLFEKL